MQISTVPEIFKLEKSIKYANKMIDDFTHSTKYYIKYANRALLANLLHRPLKLGRLVVLLETHIGLQKIRFPWQRTLFQSPPTDSMSSRAMKSHTNERDPHKRTPVTRFRNGLVCYSIVCKPYAAISVMPLGETTG